MPKSSSFKGQFFILSTFTILTILFFLSRYIQPIEIIDISQVVFADEVFVFNNIKEKAIETVKISKSCDEVKYNLEEYKNFAVRFASKIGKLLFSYQFRSPCKLPTGEEIPAVIEFNITLISYPAKLNTVFYETWRPLS